jgi:hypothetical protein
MNYERRAERCPCVLNYVCTTVLYSPAAPDHNAGLDVDEAVIVNGVARHLIIEVQPLYGGVTQVRRDFRPDLFEGRETHLLNTGSIANYRDRKICDSYGEVQSLKQDRDTY